jgi:hypothetical protein
MEKYIKNMFGCIGYARWKWIWKKSSLTWGV